MNGEEGITDLVRGCILPLQEKHAELFKKEGGVFKKDLDVFPEKQWQQQILPLFFIITVITLK